MAAFSRRLVDNTILNARQAAATLLPSEQNGQSPPETTLALTTLFSPPASCFQPTFTTSIDTYGLDKQFITRGVQTQCYPPDYTSLTLASVAWAYSPGVCPSSYAISSGVVNGQGSDAVTTAICCPETAPGYAFASIDSSGACYFSTTPAATGAQVPMFVANGATTPSPDIASKTVQYPPFLVAWASSDLPNFTPASAPLQAALFQPTGTTSVIVATAAVTSTSPPLLATQSVTPNNHGLSAAGRAAIGAAVAAICLVAIFVGGLVYWRRRQARREEMRAFAGKPAQMPGTEKKLPPAYVTELGFFQAHSRGPSATSNDSQRGFARDTDFEDYELSNNRRSIQSRFSN